MEDIDGIDSDVFTYLHLRDLKVIRSSDFHSLMVATRTLKEAIKGLEKVSTALRDNEDQVERDLKAKAKYRVGLEKSKYRPEMKGNILEGYWNFCVKTVKVRKDLGEYSLRVNGIQSATKSTDGVLQIADIAGPPEFMKLFEAQGCMDKFLTKQQRNETLSFSRFNDAHLVFDQPFPEDLQGQQTDVVTTHFQVYRQGDFYDTNIPYFVA